MFTGSTTHETGAPREGFAALNTDAAEWEAAGFSSAEAEAYRGAWCLDPQTAAGLRDAGVTAEMAATLVGDRDLDTVAYWVSIGVYSVADALEACAVTVASEDVVH